MIRGSHSICPVPEEQRPIYQYQELQESSFFSWVSLPPLSYLSKLLTVWGVSGLFLSPITAASYPPSKHLWEFLLSSGGGAGFFLFLVLLRLYLGWYHIGSRLLSDTIIYEESGWYDGQRWSKTPEMLVQDQLIFNHQVKPALQLLQKTFYGWGGTVIMGTLLWMILPLS